MTDNLFKIEPARREAAPMLAGFIGRSGSGKTLSALLFARGLVGPNGKIVMIDTEGKRSLIYADNPEVAGFDHMNFVPPFSSDRFREAINQALKAGADCIVIDSASHEHEAEGGFLDYADAEEMRLGNHRGASRSKWIRPKGARNQFIRAMTSAPCHMILCIRQKLIVDTDQKPAVKIGKAVGGEDLMFELQIAIELEPETHKTRFSKVPLPFQQHIREGEIIRAEHGALLLSEASKGVPRDVETDNLIRELKDQARNGWTAAQNAWEATWHNATPAQREVMKQNMPELKRIAKEAETVAPPEDPETTPGQFGEMPPHPSDREAAGND